ncbi:hypothetical protein K5X82_00015 [Halosquirtibacter xylanolyticus]|uniref:hypothetical protein n=1 Tax=Halosquirtibacter xylanolyticus TaxID=3374599 RepID=UPI0037493C95|nr:hypothetical protein K5X82_00015 [Prolixibacteraceae bacterium]
MYGWQYDTLSFEEKVDRWCLHNPNKRVVIIFHKPLLIKSIKNNLLEKSYRTKPIKTSTIPIGTSLGRWLRSAISSFSEEEFGKLNRQAQKQSKVIYNNITSELAQLTQRHSHIHISQPTTISDIIISENKSNM